jgi:hypothetical protein
VGRLWTIIGIALVAGAIYATLEPVAVFGYDADALAESLESEAPNAHGATDCREQGQAWLCFTGTDTDVGFNAAYQVTVDSDGCWVARRVPYGHDENPPAEEQSACVDILDVTGLSGLFDI